MNIELIQGDLLQADTDVIVNPANSRGTMDDGIAKAIKQAGGETIQAEVATKTPIAIGTAIITTAGKLPFKGIIHAPTMVHPTEPIPVKQVELATMAALRAADEAGYVSVAFPALGTGAGQVKPVDAAQIMVETIQMYIPDQQLKLVKIYLHSEELYLAFQHYL